MFNGEAAKQFVMFGRVTQNYFGLGLVFGP